MPRKVQKADLHSRALMLDCSDPVWLSGIAALHRLRGVWRDVEGVDRREASNKLETYQGLFALPCDHNVRKPIWLPGNLRLDLSQRVMQNVSRFKFRFRAHTLNVGTASWEDGISPVCDRCSCGQIQGEAHVLFIGGYEGVCALRQKHFELFRLYLVVFLMHNLSCGNNLVSTRSMVTAWQAVSDFLLQHNKKLFTRRRCKGW
eukprot:1154067-Pelagomonas_calceolata.AAC.1